MLRNQQLTAAVSGCTAAGNAASLAPTSVTAAAAADMLLALSVSDIARIRCAVHVLIRIGLRALVDRGSGSGRCSLHMTP